MVVQPIIHHLEYGAYDLVVFTRDALNEHEVCVGGWANKVNGTCVNGSSLVKESPGSQVVEGLLTAANQNYPADKILMYTKNTDDWMTELAACTLNPGCWPSESTFDTENDFAGLNLKDVLMDRGFNPLNTRLHVTGIQTNRCVMKGSLHARKLGFRVTLKTDAVAGPEESDRWTTDPDVAGTSEWPWHLAPEVCAGAECTDEWLTSVYTGWRGGPTLQMAFDYMRAGGVEIDGNYSAAGRRV
jgi:nicotinamidase-related amidase